MTVEAHSQ